MIFLLDRTDPNAPFPDVEQAEREPDGLLAIGGDLSQERLWNAYRRGIFPWYSQGQPILWWSPDPRLVLYPQRLRISRSLRKTLRRGPFTATLDWAFGAVLEACAGPRRNALGTWLVPDMRRAYMHLHHQHLAHSVEVWAHGELVGGLYGVAIGRVFFGESMFSHRDDASKVALVHLVDCLIGWGYQLIDCQVHTEHLERLGAEEIPRQRFSQLLDTWCPLPGREGSWRASTPVPPRIPDPSAAHPDAVLHEVTP